MDALLSFVNVESQSLLFYRWCKMKYAVVFYIYIYLKQILILGKDNPSKYTICWG